MTQIQGVGTEALVKYPKIFALGSEENEGILNEIVVIQSKIDGANFRARYIVDEERFIYGSRSNLLLPDTNPNSWKAIQLYELSLKEYKDAIIPDVMYCSESMQKHTICYENISPTIGYDIFDLKEMKFYPWKQAKKAFEDIGISFINIHYEKHGRDVTIEELNELIKKSPYRKEGDEGIVIKCYNRLNKYERPLFAKIVTSEFKEQNKAVFGENGQSKKQPKDNEIKIADTYLTQSRFDKSIHHFIDENEKIGMELMPKLYRYVMKDILTEYIIDISEDYNSVDFTSMSKIIAARCANMLKSYLLTKAK